MYIYTPLCRYWIALYRYVLVFIVPHVDIELEDNKQFNSNIPRNMSLHGKLEFKSKILFMKIVRGVYEKSSHLSTGIIEKQDWAGPLGWAYGQDL